MNTEHSDTTLTFLISQGFSPTILERFWAKVQKTDGCWLWNGCRIKTGYGRINIRGHGDRIDYAHRVSWMIHNGTIPIGMFVCHNCPGGDNPSCVNPNHLFLGTSGDNSRDMERKCRTGLSAKLDVQKVAEIRILIQTIKMSEIAQRFGVSASTICMIKHGKTWKNTARL